jgi:uncharacterized protein involved in exopolysaccharide biosynthesis
MNESSNTPRESPESRNHDLVQSEAHQSIQVVADDQVSLLDLWITLWRSKWLIVGITSVFAVLSIPYALIQTEWYRADVLLAPAEERSTSGLARQLGGLVGLAGVTVGGGGSAEPLAILQSREFVAAFIEEQELLPVLYAKQWDSQAGNWIAESPDDRPDIRDAVEYFNKNVIFVTEDAASGLVTLTIHWTEPQLAAEWANMLVRRLNGHLRKRALLEAESNVAYLQEELSGTNVVTLQQSVGRLLEAELQKVMLARGNEEFAFRVIDRAHVPKTRFKPRRRLIVILATFLGGMFAVLFVLANHAVGAARKQVAS